jgi:hypothetical protein
MTRRIIQEHTLDDDQAFRTVKMDEKAKEKETATKVTKH